MGKTVLVASSQVLRHYLWSVIARPPGQAHALTSAGDQAAGSRCDPAPAGSHRCFCGTMLALGAGSVSNSWGLGTGGDRVIRTGRQPLEREVAR